MAVASGPLTNVQLEILQLFPYHLEDDDLLELKRVLVRHFAKKLDEEVDQLFEEKGWGEEKLEEWKNAHDRTPYKPQ
ncbi:MAG: hypothetical protein AAGF89_14340 [Bacteroidota bacterium]